MNQVFKIMQSLEKRMVPKSITILSLLALLIAGCAAASPNAVPLATPTNAPTLDFSPPTPASLVSPTSDHPPSPVVPPTNNPDQQKVLNLAFSVVKAIKDKD